METWLIIAVTYTTKAVVKLKLNCFSDSVWTNSVLVSIAKRKKKLNQNLSTSDLSQFDYMRYSSKNAQERLLRRLSQERCHVFFLP